MVEHIYQGLLDKNKALEAERDRALLALADLHERLQEAQVEMESLRAALADLTHERKAG